MRRDVGARVLPLREAFVQYADSWVHSFDPQCHSTTGFRTVLLALRAELRKRGVFTPQDQPRLDALLDLVALGTVADVVKLDANNRLLVAQGLRRMRAGRMCPGIAALFRVAGRDARRASTFDLGFGLGPRLNAAGRLADMSLGIECLLTDDYDRAMSIAAELDGMNRERREIELPEATARLMLTILDNMAEGRPISLTPHDAEVSTQVAADILNVSRPFVIKLVDNGTLPCRRVGTHRRLRMADVLAHKRTMEAEFEAAARELSEIGQELGGYD